MTNRMEMFRGDNKSWTVTINDQDGNTVDLTGAEIYLTVRENNISDTALIQLKNTAAGGSADEIEDSDLPNGEFKVHFVPENTEDIEISFDEYIDLVYDIQIVVNSKTYTVIKNVLRLKADITI